MLRWILVGTLAVVLVAAGLVALLFDRDLPGYGLPLPFLIGTALFSAVILLATGAFAVRARHRRVVSGDGHMVGASGPVLSVNGNDSEGYAHIQGERWRVTSTTPLAIGQIVRVTDVKGLTLQVEPQDSTTATRSLL